MFGCPLDWSYGYSEDGFKYAYNVHTGESYWIGDTGEFIYENNAVEGAGTGKFTFPIIEDPASVYDASLYLNVTSNIRFGNLCSSSSFKLFFSSGLQLVP